MRIALIVIFLAASAFAQEEPPVPAACGPQDTNFKVKLDESKHTIAQPEPGKARVYFIQDVGRVSCLGGCFKIKIGVNGTWMGANQHNSYFSVLLEPGEHHMCADAGYMIALAHFVAEAGKVYYFRIRAFDTDQRIFDFDLIDSDQTKYLIASYPLSVSRPNR
jgi:hypothetical protein